MQLKNSFCRAGSKHAENCSWSSLSIIAGRYPDPKLKDIFTSTIQYSHTLHKQYLKWVKFRSFDFLGETYASSWRNLRKLNDQMLLQGGPPILPQDPGTFQVIDTLIDWSTDRLIDWSTDASWRLVGPGRRASLAAPGRVLQSHMMTWSRNSPGTALWPRGPSFHTGEHKPVRPHIPRSELLSVQCQESKYR